MADVNPWIEIDTGWVHDLVDNEDDLIDRQKLIAALVKDGWSQAGSEELVKLAHAYGAGFLVAAYEIALAIGKTEGDLGFI